MPHFPIGIERKISIKAKYENIENKTYKENFQYCVWPLHSIFMASDSRTLITPRINWIRPNSPNGSNNIPFTRDPSPNIITNGSQSWHTLRNVIKTHTAINTRTNMVENKLVKNFFKIRHLTFRSGRRGSLPARPAAVRPGSGETT